MRRTAWIVAVGAIAAVYLISLPSEPGSWDTAEMQTVPYLLGIGHQTGFPLFVAVGYLFAHVFAIGTIAYRLNLLSAIFMTGACAALAACACEVEIPIWLAIPATWLFGWTRIVWQHATRSEVHDLALLLLAALLLVMLRWMRTGDRRMLVAGGAVFACALATHAVTIMVIPAMLFALLVRRNDLRWREVLIGCGVASLGIAAYALIPLRSAYIVSRGLDPTQGLFCVNGGIDWNFDNPSTLHDFAIYISGAQFGAANALVDALRVDRWPADVATVTAQLQQSFGTLGVALAVAGLVTLAARNWRYAVLLALFGFCIVPFAQEWAAVEGDPDRYRFLPMLVTALFAACAGGAVLGRQASWLRQSIVAVSLVVLSGSALYANRDFIGQNDPGGRHVIAWAAQGVPENAIVVTPWLDATTLAYGVFADGSLPRRIVVAAWYDKYLSCYPQWAKTHRVYILTNGRLAPPFVLQRTFDDSHLLYRYGK